jgi:hypothetical protein
MNRDRIVQLVAPLVTVLALAASGRMLPGILRASEENVLRYTNVSVDNAPPFVALGTAIGALRGLIVDYLWIKVNAMKEKGLFYEVISDADMITKLQPRFAAVWAFHGHNMAYNISVATNTKEERWQWVNAGIRLVRDKGLRYNPNDLQLHRELAFWFAHKIEGVSDDAHLYYKRELCREWHMLLGEPPDGYPERIAWIKNIADAPESLEAAEQRTPGVLALVERLKATYPTDIPGLRFGLNRQFLSAYMLWESLKQRSAAAKLRGLEQKARANDPSFVAFDEVASDPAVKAPLDTLIAHVRKRVLVDEYNMNPQLMYEYTRDLGPIDWRHGQAHALYWSRRGSEFGKGRISKHDIYIVLNNDSQQMQAMQDLARFGRISYDIFSAEALPGRFPDPRWIDTIFDMFPKMYLKHYDVEGGGGERFIQFLQNFMAGAVREWFRQGETERAQKIMDKLDEYFGHGVTGNPIYRQPLDLFVYNETYDQYQARPDLAPNDIAASLKYGLKVGILNGRPEVLHDALVFAQQVTSWFKNNSWNAYKTKFGEGRISELIGNLEDSSEIAFAQVMTDPGMKMQDRMTIWSATDQVESAVIGRGTNLLGRSTPLFRALVYDQVMPVLAQQFQSHELSLAMTVDQAFPPPPGLDIARKLIADRDEQRRKQQEEIQARDPFTHK